MLPRQFQTALEGNTFGRKSEKKKRAKEKRRKEKAVGHVGIFLLLERIQALKKHVSRAHA